MLASARGSLLRSPSSCEHVLAPALLTCKRLAAVTCEPTLRAGVSSRRSTWQSSRRHRPGKCRAATQAAAGLPPQLAFNVTTLAVMPLYGLMIALPKKQLTRSVITSPWFYTAGSLLYAFALACWSQHGIFGSILGAFSQALSEQQIPAFAALFQRPEVTALSWIHLLLLDLCVARHVYLDGLKKQVVTAHSIVLCFMFGPTGLLSHMLTKRFLPKQQQPAAAPSL